MDEVAEIRPGGAALAADTMAFRALKLRANKKFMSMLPIAVGLARRAARMASRPRGVASCCCTTA